MTGGARIGNFIFFGHGGGNESKGVGADFNVCNSRFDFGHVTGDATASSGIFLVVSTLFESAGVRAI